MSKFASQYVTEDAVLDWVNKKAQALQFCRFKVGKYTGDAAATKAITGVGFKPTFLVIYSMVTKKAMCIKSSQDTTSCFVLTGTVNAGTHVDGNLYLDDVVISLDALGFTVGDGTGSSNYANEAADYAYIAFG